MLPTLRPGDEVVVDLESPDVRRGDLVMIRQGEQLVVHRLIDAGSPIKTRGDNVSRLDIPTGPQQLVGRVIEIRRGGRCIPRHGRWRRMLDGALGGLSDWTLRHQKLERVFRLCVRYLG